MVSKQEYSELKKEFRAIKRSLKEVKDQKINSVSINKSYQIIEIASNELPLGALIQWIEAMDKKYFLRNQEVTDKTFG